MIVAVSATTAEVVEPDELTALAARLDGVDAAGADATLRAVGAGVVSDGHAWLRIEFLRAAGPADDDQWAEGFAGMVSYAQGKGWVSEDGSSVRAHLETA